MNRTKLAAGIAVLILAAGPAAPQGTIGKGDPVLYGRYKGLEAFGVTDAWRLGITGRGVKVAVIDDGIDFGTPDLYGAQARVETPGSPYQGWPIVIDLLALKDYQQSGKPSGYTGYVDTSSTKTEGLKVTGTSRSGVYHVGSHTDRLLTDFHKEAVKVLVVDEKEAGIYDTVYVDLNNNKDFTDDKPCRRGDETAVRDRDGDGLNDETGGMVYFIADGANPPPPGRLLYAKDARVPARGELVAFHFVMSAHGTMCAGTIAARGRNVRGIAPEASLIAVLGWSGNEMELCLLTALGYDGLPGTGDEASVISRSAGFDLFNKGADEITAFMEYLTTKAAPATTLVYASGNEGSGYGTCSAPSADHVITAGAIEDLWWRLSSQRGEVVAFSSRGPNVLGKVKPNILGNGEWSPRVRPILSTHNGRTAWDKDGGGTSNATPHVAAITALIYQAYKRAHGEFPTSDIARDILMSSADDIDEEVFAQGAGTINARRAAVLAMGTAKDGALIRPAMLVTDPVEAGTSLEFKLRVSDDPARPVTMTPVKLYKTGEKRFGIGAAGDTRLYPIDKDMLKGDLLKVSSIFAMDPALKDLESSTGYWVFLYKWTDRNKDGRYADSPDATLAQAQKGELEVMAGSVWDHIITAEVRVHDPVKRSGEGLVLGLEKNGKVKSRDVTIVLESYSWKPWEGATITRTGNEVAFRVLAPAETGISQGKILISTKGAATKQCVPVSFATYVKDAIKASATSEPYEPLRLYGRLEGSGRFGFRDARFFSVLHKGEELVAASVQWETMGSDFDLVLYGPGTVDTSRMWTFPAKPPVELPKLPVMVENGHSLKRVETVWPIDWATKKTIAANLREGLNILVVNKANSAGRVYGERIEVSIEKLGKKPAANLELKAKAGEILKFEAGELDAVAGFALPVAVEYGERPVMARKGEVLVFRQRGEYYFPSLYYDTNDNGRLDPKEDEVVFREVGGRTIDPGIGDVVPVPYDGRYFVADFVGDLFQFQGRWVKDGSSISVAAPKVPGAYLGIAEKGGLILPVRVTLNVAPGDAVAIEAVLGGRVIRGRPFDLKLRTVDANGNAVKADAEAKVVFGKTAKAVKIANGEGVVTLAAPKKEGRYQLQVEARLKAAATAIEVVRGAAVEITSIVVDGTGLKVRLLNTGSAAIRADVHANPCSYLLPELTERPELGEQGMFYAGGYKNGYLPYSAAGAAELAAGEERETVLAVPKLKDMGDQAAKVPYIVVVTDPSGNAISYAESVPFRPEIPGLEPVARRAKSPEAVEKASVGEAVSFLAEGLVTFQLGKLPPLYFLPAIAGAVAIVPDESGALEIRTGGKTRVLDVAARAVADGDKTPPARPERTAIAWDGRQVIVTWAPPADADVDHYNVYRIGGMGVMKAGEVKVAEYRMDGQLWGSYNFRITAVDKAGNESKPCDPVGIVTTPPAGDTAG